MTSALLRTHLLTVLFLAPGCAELRWRTNDVQLPTYECHRAETPLEIDGVLDEPSWERAAVITTFYQLEKNDAPRSRTEARLLWDDENLYVGFVAYDHDICAWGEKRDDNIFEGDVVEGFVKPHADREDYYEFNVNPENVFFDAYYAYGHAGQWRFAKWNSSVVTSVKCFGTLDNWHDRDDKWQVEYRIPFETLPSLKAISPKLGDSWRFHVARYNYSVYLEDRDSTGKVSAGPGREIHSSAPLQGFHQVDKFARLKFAR